MINYHYNRNLIMYCKNIRGTCVECWVELFVRSESQHKSQASPPISVRYHVGIYVILELRT
jgi:hypothetical protein